MLTLADIVKDLGFVLAIDHCARGCGHCPAFGDRTPVQRAPLARLARTVETVAAARRRLGLGTPGQVVHSWRISDPLDYLHRQPSGHVATCADVAALWRTHLGQGLYVVTNGSEGSPTARRALTELVAAPELISQVKLTITHADRSFATPRYVPELAHDVAQLAPLWRLPSTRREDLPGLRFRINVKATAARTDEMRECVLNVLAEAGLSRSRSQELCADRQRVQFKPIYDLGNATGTPSPVTGAIGVRDPSGKRYKPTTETRERRQFGIRPDGRLFAVDMYAFTETDLTEGDQPATWPAELDEAHLHAPLNVFAHV